MPIWMAIEDEESINNIILSMFEVWGVSGLSFSDGADVVAWIEQVERGAVHNSELPELALIDIRIPSFSGAELATRIRASKRLGSMAIVMMTAYRLDLVQEKQILEKTEANLLIYKPLPSMLPLRNILESVLTGRKIHDTAHLVILGKPYQRITSR